MVALLAVLWGLELTVHPALMVWEEAVAVVSPFTRQGTLTLAVMAVIPVAVVEAVGPPTSALEALVALAGEVKCVCGRSSKAGIIQPGRGPITTVEGEPCVT